MADVRESIDVGPFFVHSSGRNNSVSFASLDLQRFIECDRVKHHVSSFSLSVRDVQLVAIRPDGSAKSWQQLGSS